VGFLEPLLHRETVYYIVGRLPGNFNQRRLRKIGIGLSCWQVSRECFKNWSL